MFRARASWSRLSKRLKPFATRSFCSKSNVQTNKNSNNGKINGDSKVESDLSSYNEAYKQLGNLDFMTASKILFTQTPKKKKFGSSLFACRLWDLELKKKKEEEEKAKQIELEEIEKIHEKNPELQELTTRLEKLEATIKEIAVASQKQSGSGIITKNSGKGQDVDKTKHGADIDPSRSTDDHLGGQEIASAPVLPKGCVSESTT